MKGYSNSSSSLTLFFLQEDDFSASQHREDPHIMDKTSDYLQRSKTEIRSPPAHVMIQSLISS